MLKIFFRTIVKNVIFALYKNSFFHNLFDELVKPQSEEVVVPSMTKGSSEITPTEQVSDYDNNTNSFSHEKNPQSQKSIPSFDKSQLWQIRHDCICHTIKNRQVKQITKTLPKPFDFCVNTLSGLFLVLLQIQQIYPELLEENNELFEESIRDIKMRIGQFDTIIGREALLAVKEGKIEYDDKAISAYVSSILDKIGGTIEEPDFVYNLTDWINISTTTVGKTVKFIQELSDNGDEEAQEFISNMLSTILNGNKKKP
jgi:hypothetical protein